MTDKHTEFLRKDAIDRVWCAPDQDYYFTLELPRITTPAGVVGKVVIGGLELDLPDDYSRWQVFQIGGISPGRFKLKNVPLKWVTAEEQANDVKTSIRIYTSYGLVVGLADIFFRYTLSSNLVVAVRTSRSAGVDWTMDNFYLTLFSNAFWNSEDGLTNPTGFEVGAKLLDTAADVTAFKQQYQSALNKAENSIQMNFWQNGVRVSYSKVTLKVGDSVWYELDGAIKKRYSFSIKGLASFDSTLDKIRKYLLHPAKDDNINTIDFIDSLELFLVAPDTKQTALHFARLLPEHLRQLTHRDYSVSVKAIAYQATKMLELTQQVQDKLTIQVVVKSSAMVRSLVHEGAFIQELYKLQEADIKRAITGIDATVPFWRAAALEASAYPKLMRAEGVCDIEYKDVEDAYGYYAMARALARTPSVVISPGNNGFVDVPYLYMWGCTAYEYDADGNYLGWKQHVRGEKYFVMYDTTRRVELIAGMGGKALEEYHGVTQVQLRTDCNWRVYLRQRIGGQVQPGFKDVTGSDLYTISSTGLFKWKKPKATEYVTVRSDRRFFAADYTLDLLEGRLVVNMVTTQTHDGVVGAQVIDIPLGQTDVLFNGRSLIRGLDYFYEAGQIVITAREYVNQVPGQQQKVHVRAMGFCRADGSLYPEGDFGFIQHGVLSNNNRFDVRDGRVTRVIVNGQLKDMDQLIFSEETNQVAPVDPSNGLPYMVKDVFIPLKPFSLPDTWSLIEEGRDRTKIVSDYITLKKPQPNRGPVQAIHNKYRVLSPFLAKLLYDLLYGRLVLPPKASFNHQDVMEVCKSYEPLLKTDPLQRGFDPKFMDIVPHTKDHAIAVAPQHWQFLSQVVRYYAEGVVDLNRALKISS